MGVRFRWYSGESDIVPATPQAPQQRRYIHVGRWAAAIALLVIIAAGSIRGQSQKGLRAAQADLQRVIDGEIAALRSCQRDAYFELLDTRYRPWLRYHQEIFDRQAAWYAARPEVRAEVESVTLGAEMAVAHVRLRDGQGGQTAEPAQWYFRRVNGQWRHAPPISELWGAKTSLRMS